MPHDAGNGELLEAELERSPNFLHKAYFRICTYRPPNAAIGLEVDSHSVLTNPLSTMAEPPQTDVSRPSALPTANLKLTSNVNQSIVDQNSAEYLEQIEEEWNKKVDVEVETLVDGMVDLVSLASASTILTLMLSGKCL